jgi:hypothetical protein
VQARPVHDPHGVDKAACCHCAIHASIVIALVELLLTETVILIPCCRVIYLMSLILIIIRKIK